MKQTNKLASILIILMLLSTGIGMAAIPQTTEGSSKNNSIQIADSNKDAAFLWDIQLCSNKPQNCGTVFTIPKNKGYVKILLKLTYKNFPTTLQPYATLRWNIIDYTDPGKLVKPYRSYKLNYKGGKIVDSVKIYKPGSYMVYLGPAMCGANCKVYFTIKK